MTKIFLSMRDSPCTNVFTTTQNGTKKQKEAHPWNAHLLPCKIKSLPPLSSVLGELM